MFGGEEASVRRKCSWETGKMKREKEKKNNNKMPERREIYSSKKRKIIKSVNVRVSECSKRDV